MGDERFKSEVDWWIYVLLFTILLSGSFDVIQGHRSDDSELMRAGVSFLGTSALCLLLVVFPLRYTVTEDSIRIRFGLFRRTIPLEDIRSVRPTRSWWSNPALSLDRLHIACDNRMDVAISPKSRREFLELVERRCPQLAYSENREGLIAAPGSELADTSS